MRTFFHTRVLRRTVWMALGIWLFALAAGMANACLLQPDSGPGHAVAAAPADHAGHRDDGGRQDAKTPCTKVCDDAKQASLKVASVTADAVEEIAGPTYPQQAPEPSPAAHFDGWTRASAAPPDPPPRLQFVRLAL